MRKWHLPPGLLRRPASLLRQAVPLLFCGEKAMEIGEPQKIVEIPLPAPQPLWEPEPLEPLEPVEEPLEPVEEPVPLRP